MIEGLDVFAAASLSTEVFQSMILKIPKKTKVWRLGERVPSNT